MARIPALPLSFFPTLFLAFFAAFFAALVPGGPLWAQGSEGGAGPGGQTVFAIGGDRFAAGQQVLLGESGADDLFVAGQSATLTAPVSGSVHAMAQDLALDGAVGGDLFATGMNVVLNGAVAGDASLMGYRVVVAAPVEGDLRATGSRLRLDAPVGGYALLSAGTLDLNAAISGDVSLQAGRVIFGPDARIGGRLTLYESGDRRIEVPPGVIPADRIERRDLSRWEGGDGRDMARRGWQHVAWRFAAGVLIVAAIAGLIAAVAPRHMARMRATLLDAPFRTLWFGFLTQSVLAGSAILFAMTLVGILVVPASALVAVLAGLFGYVVGAYALGVGLSLLAGRGEPESLGARVVAAVVGALAAGLIGLVPLLGWIFVLALTLAGVGAISVWLFRPAFFVEP